MFTFTWRIENFCLLLQSRGDFIKSPTFEIKNMKNLKAYIQLYPRGEKNEEFITYCLIDATTLESLSLEYVKVKFSFTRNGVKIAKEQAVCQTVDLFHTFKRIKIEKPNKIQSLFSMKDNVDLECVIEKFYVYAGTPLTCYGKTVVLHETYSHDLSPFRIRSSPCTKNLEWSKTLTLKEPATFKHALELQNEGEKTVEISKISETSSPLIVCCQVSVLNATRKTVLFCDGYVFEPCFKTESWKKKLDVCAGTVGETMTLRCEIIASDGSTVSYLGYDSEPTAKTIPITIESEKNSCELLKDIYATKAFPDVVLKVGDAQFPSHKCVLASVSDVFAAVFKNMIKDGGTSVVDITDIDGDIVGKMLKFVYAGKVENLELDSLENLYYVADAYQIVELKNLCSFHIAKMLTMDSFIRILEFGDDHSDSVLIEAASNFIYAHRKEVFNSDNWKCFMEKSVVLAAHVMFQICKAS